MLRGSCLCQGVAFEIDGTVIDLLFCHCSMCRKAHGSAFRARGKVKTSEFRWVRGEQMVRYHESSAGNYRGFCSVCGSKLISKFTERPHVLGLALGVLDDDPIDRPLCHVFVGSKAPWYQITDSLPQFEQLPTGPLTNLPVAVIAAEVPTRIKPSVYPEPFASRMVGREKRQLGEVFDLKKFGVNLTRLAPNAVSALRHAHTKQDEFIYILQGQPTLHTDEGQTRLSPGMCAGFKAGTGNGHHLINETTEEVVYLEVGDRSPGDEGSYPDDDLKALLVESKWQFVHKDGVPYE